MYSKNKDLPRFKEEERLEKDFRYLWETVGRCPEFLDRSNIYCALVFLKKHGVGKAFELTRTIKIIKWLDNDEYYFNILMGRFMEYMIQEEGVEK